MCPWCQGTEGNLLENNYIITWEVWFLDTFLGMPKPALLSDVILKQHSFTFAGIIILKHISPTFIELVPIILLLEFTGWVKLGHIKSDTKYKYIHINNGTEIQRSHETIMQLCINIIRETKALKHTVLSFKQIGYSLFTLKKKIVYLFKIDSPEWLLKLLSYTSIITGLSGSTFSITQIDSPPEEYFWCLN